MTDITTHDTPLTLASLYLHPIKSCAGIAVADALLIETGLEFDRDWMLVGPDGDFTSQRELPRMALVQTKLRSNDLVLRAPGMLALHLALDRVEAPCRVRVWDDEVAAFDMGDLAAQWFSTFLGRPLRVARFDPDVRRPADPAWAGSTEAPTTFVDQFPLMVLSNASLAEFNRRLAAAGHGTVTMARFRPNLVLDGLADAHGEDFIDELTIAAPEGPVVLRMVKPCTRCTIPDVDPATAERAYTVADTLAGYRADPRVGGRLTFGMHAVIVSGVGRMLRAGASASATLRF